MMRLYRSSNDFESPLVFLALLIHVKCIYNSCELGKAPFLETIVRQRDTGVVSMCQALK